MIKQDLHKVRGKLSRVGVLGYTIVISLQSGAVLPPPLLSLWMFGNKRSAASRLLCRLIDTILSKIFVQEETPYFYFDTT